MTYLKSMRVRHAVDGVTACVGVAAAVIVVAGLPPVVLGLLMYRQIARAMLAGAVKG